MFGNLRLCEIHPTLLSYQVLSMQIQSTYSTSVRKKEIQILKDFFLISCHSNLHWFFMNWHSKHFPLLYQFYCIFVLKLLLVGCRTFTLMVYPLQCLLDIWLSWAIWSSIWVLFFKEFCAFRLFICICVTFQRQT